MKQLTALNNHAQKAVLSKSTALVFANDIRKVILNLADKRGAGNSFYPVEVAKRLDPENWQTLIDQIHLVADSLIQEGQLSVSQSGKALKTAYTKKV